MTTLTTAEKLRVLRNLVRVYQLQVFEREIEAASKLAAAEEGYRLWHENDENTFGRCPYNVEAAKKRYEEAKAERLKMEQVAKFVVDVYVDKSEIK